MDSLVGIQANLMAYDYSQRQTVQYECQMEIVDAYGPWTQDAGNNGAHYFRGEDNPFIDEGIICENCVYFEGPGGCQIVSGSIDSEGLCKLWIIPQDRLEF